MPHRSPYDVLAVPHSATQAEIKAVYRALAMRLHPDRHAHEVSSMSRDERTRRFKEVSEAYAFLSEKRALVDAHFLRRPIPQPTFYYHDVEDPTVWRGPRPGWTYSPAAKKWRMRFWIAKFLVVGFLAWGTIVGNMSNVSRRKQAMRRRRQAAQASQKGQQVPSAAPSE
ncbi:DnaJ domain-containing protein [Hyaloraphidium curvatum]|nr:DnaJ domain-containing protein [Hyaloraphidium curvatum]